MNYKFFFLSAYFLLLTSCLISARTNPRAIILTDSEVDDRCSMVNLLLYANDIDIAAFIQCNSCFQTHGWSNEHWLEKQIDHYAEVYPNLKKHDVAYPSPDELKQKIFVGDEDSTHLVVNNRASMRYPGQEPVVNPSLWDETPGSKQIVEVLLENDTRKVFILAWGGGNTAAKAFQVLKEKYPKDYDRAVSKAVMYNIWYQDGAGAYIERNHPKVTMLLSHYFNGTWTYGVQSYTGMFVKENLHENHGPLCAEYVQNMISEGDSPAFFYLLAPGLRSCENPTYGGWGGRFYQVKGFENVYRDTDQGAYFRWTEYILRDFEARAQWCVADSYEKANHQPIIHIDGAIDRKVKSGMKITLSARVEDKDPVNVDYMWSMTKDMWEKVGVDKEKLAKMYESDLPKTNDLWWQYREAGTYPYSVDLRMKDLTTAEFIAPKVNSPQTIHFIFQSTDQGKPNLTAFQRVIVTVVP